MHKLVRICLLLTFAIAAEAQIYSPKVLRSGQPDSTDLRKFAEAIYAQSGARTPRQKAEAIWRFFLTDGRFVKSNYWYHIAGWTYEEPSGEVLDPIKLLNSYGFGLCYHIAPLLEAVFEAGGLPARCWFLTGHTVTEVFYDGSYHYFDSDMMGYNVAGLGSFRGKPVASVHDLERDGNIILDKLQSPKQVKPGVVDDPWYPADVRAGAMDGLAELFTSTANNRLYPFTRYSPGHNMDFVLRPGEKLIRFFKPEEAGLFYLPYKLDGSRWTEFPQEIAEYQIRTADGPRSQKDDRLWATGRMEYDPPGALQKGVTIIDMPSPYVIIDARFAMNADLSSEGSSLSVETSVDGGRTWTPGGQLHGPHHGTWTTEPKVVVTSQHGRLTAVSGKYGYRLRIVQNDPAHTRVASLHLVTRIQLNPRSLPAVQAGSNSFTYSAAAPIEKVEVPAPLAAAPVHGLQLITEQGQQFLLPESGQTGEALYVLDAGDRTLTGFDAGARFLDLRDGLAPDKLTAETRHTKVKCAEGPASLSWSLSPEGPFHALWNYSSKLEWKDGQPIDRLLLWPEVFHQIRALPPGTKRVYVKFSTAGPAFDKVRLALYTASSPASGHLKITQAWSERGMRHEHVEQIEASTTKRSYSFNGGSDVVNESVTLSNE